MNTTTIESICDQLAMFDLIRFRTQYAIGRLLLAELDGKVTRGGAPAGQRKPVSLLASCEDIAQAVYARSGRRYSVAWFKYCYYYAKAFTPDQYKQLVKHNPPQNALMVYCFRTPQEIDAAIRTGKFNVDPRAKRTTVERVNVDKIDHGPGEPDQTIVFTPTWEGPDAYENKFAAVLAMHRDHMGEMLDAWQEATRKVRT